MTTVNMSAAKVIKVITACGSELFFRPKDRLSVARSISVDSADGRFCTEAIMQIEAKDMASGDMIPCEHSEQIEGDIDPLHLQTAMEIIEAPGSKVVIRGDARWVRCIVATDHMDDDRSLSARVLRMVWHVRERCGDIGVVRRTLVRREFARATESLPPRMIERYSNVLDVVFKASFLNYIMSSPDAAWCRSRLTTRMADALEVNIDEWKEYYVAQQVITLASDSPDAQVACHTATLIADMRGKGRYWNIDIQPPEIRP